MYKKWMLAPVALSLLTGVLDAAQPNARQEHEHEMLLKQISKGFSQVAKKATPAVVYIESQSAEKPASRPRGRGSPSENPFDYFNNDFFNRFYGQPGKQERQPPRTESVRGSGFLISADGYIVTNNHVVENTSKITVTLHSGKKVAATVVGCDPKTDLAVIKIAETGLPFLTFGNSDLLEVGDWAIAVGNPFGLQATVTVGVVSAKGRSQLHIADFEDFIQTDAAINPGNSGGPLLNVEAEVIGVNTAIVSGSGGYIGIGFAIPSTMAKQVVDQLLKEGQVTRGFLGVTLQPLDTNLASYYKLDSTKGALVTDIIKGSPADTAGLHQEDIILSYNGTAVESLSSLRNFISLLPPGTRVSLRVLREGKEMTLQVTTSSAPTEDLSKVSTAISKLGLKVQNLTPDNAQQLGYTDATGVLIVAVEPQSPAAEAGLRPGGLIQGVNKKPILNVEQLNAALSDASKEGRALLKVRHGDAYLFVALRFAP